MDTTLAVTLALGAGIVGGAVGMRIARRGAAAAAAGVESAGPTLVDRRIADSLPVAFVVIGVGDEVLVSNRMARERQVTTGRDLSAEPLRALVRQARRTRAATHLDHDDGRRLWRVSAVPLDDDRIAVLADDRTEARRVDEVRRD
ncbi:MAG: two-component system, OmpR family, sensor histidine kinase SenX3, partial [Frankiaceae bacterium]|nr:two-component system, OmpR family, sensor histidine kinase SenX3 [Frankiaceae bacterium]